jgi:hypothetical protein
MKYYIVGVFNAYKNYNKKLTPEYKETFKTEIEKKEYFKFEKYSDDNGYLDLDHFGDETIEEDKYTYVLKKAWLEKI